jgi:hypothetical protein
VVFQILELCKKQLSESLGSNGIDYEPQIDQLNVDLQDLLLKKTKCQRDLDTALILIEDKKLQAI